MATIHPTAVVDPKAQLAEDVSIGPFTVIGPDVSIGAGTSVGPHCVIEGHTSIGQGNKIFQFSSLGAAPQDKKYAGEPTRLVIGDRNTIREFCTFNTGTVQDAGVTTVGNDNWIMAYVHIAHDCRLGNNLIMANGATLGGHVHLDDWVFIGGLTGVHQFVRVGAHAMTGFQTRLSQDVPPFILAQGNPAEVNGFNIEGLRRRGFNAERLAAVKLMHKALYRQGLTFDESKAQIAALSASHPEAQADVTMMLNFLNASTRGIVR